MDRHAHPPAWAPRGGPGLPVTTAAPALVSGGLAAVWSRFPRATANQMLQLMVHSMGYRVTKGTGGKPAYFTAFRRSGGPLPVGSTGTGFGYGVFDPADRVKGNPLRYPDTNPLLRTDSSDQPSYRRSPALHRRRHPRAGRRPRV